MSIKKMTVRLMVMWICIYVVAGIIALLFEFGPLKGMSVTDAQTI